MRPQAAAAIVDFHLALVGGALLGEVAAHPRLGRLRGQTIPTHTDQLTKKPTQQTHWLCPIWIGAGSPARRFTSYGIWRRTHAHRILSCLVIGGPMDLDLVFVIVVVVCSAAVDADVCFICYVDEQQSLASSADVSPIG